jgi:hypothetical protein
MTDKKTLSKAHSSVSYMGNPYAVNTYSGGGLASNGLVEVPGTMRLNSYNAGGGDAPRDYREEVDQSRFFYRYDPIAATVINRMVDMASARIKNRRNECTDEEIAFFNGVSSIINPLISSIMVEYLVTGMAVPEYGLTRSMGSRIHSLLGRKRYLVPEPLWLRNTDYIVLKRLPAMHQRSVFLQVPQDERNFILNEGKRDDGTEDRELYLTICEKFPEYVRLIREGKALIRLDKTRAITRKMMSNADYPQPFLTPSLAALKHKWRIKQMDYSIASRAIEAIRQIKAGNDMYPVVEDDPALEEIRQQLSNRPGQNRDQESVYTLYTNHTVDIEWHYPPFDALLSDAKYSEPNADILLGMGFSRVLLVGESLRSNSGGDASTQGPLATLTEMRANVLDWIRFMYNHLADENGLRNVPEPFFPAIPNGDLVKLVQFAVSAVKLGAMSYDSMLRMFGSDFEAERQQKDAESKAGVADPVPDASPLDMNPTPDGVVNE